MPSSTAKTTTRALPSVVMSTGIRAPGLDTAGTEIFSDCVRELRSTANGTTPYDSGLMKSSSDDGSRRNWTLT